MIKTRIKRAAKRTLKAGYHAFGWVLPARVRREFRTYRQFRRMGGQPPAPAPAPAGIPAATAVATAPYYWERRERPGVDRPAVRVGLVGAGNYAQHHLKVLADLDRVTVTALLTAGAARGQATAARYNIPLVTQDRGQFVQRDDIDCFVVVASARYMHEITLDCLATGKPVLLEKPPGITALETASLVQQALAHHTFGMVCMNRRFYSVLEHGLAALAWAGPIRGAVMEFPLAFTSDRQSRRLAEWDYEHYYMRNAIHGVDLLRYVMGDPLAVHSLAWPNEAYAGAAASYAALLDYGQGVTATVVDLWDTVQRPRLHVVAESGWLEFEPLEAGWFISEHQDKLALRPDPVDVEYRPGVYAQDLHFINSVRRGVAPARPACLLPDAYRTMQLMERIQANSLSHPAPAAPAPTLINA